MTGKTPGTVTFGSGAGDRSFAATLRRIAPLDRSAMADAMALDHRLTKPRGALGRLEALGAQLCGIAGECPPPLPAPAAVAVFAGDHGVVAEGVTPWPQEVTAQMVANFCAGGAAINVLAGRSGPECWWSTSAWPRSCRTCPAWRCGRCGPAPATWRGSRR